MLILVKITTCTVEKIPNAHHNLVKIVNSASIDNFVVVSLVLKLNIIQSVSVLY